MTSDISDEWVEKAAEALDDAGLWPRPDEFIQDFKERAGRAVVAAVADDIRAQERERIAVAIEADASGTLKPSHYNSALRRAARIARAEAEVAR